MPSVNAAGNTVGNFRAAETITTLLKEIHV
jgi:hypothetical protein